MITTVGAVDNLEQTKTYQMLVERLAKNQRIKVFGVGQMSFGMGVGGKKRYLGPRGLRWPEGPQHGAGRERFARGVEGKPGRDGDSARCRPRSSPASSTG